MSHMSLMVVFSVLFLASFSCDGVFGFSGPYICRPDPPIPRCPGGCALILIPPECRCFPIQFCKWGICLGCPFYNCQHHIG